MISGRTVEKAGEVCIINDECNGFNCIGVVDPYNDPPVVADTVYNFFPCEDPMSFSMLATVTTLSHPVLDVVINESVSIDFTPSFLGRIHITFMQTDSGVRFGVS